MILYGREDPRARWLAAVPLARELDVTLADRRALRAALAAVPAAGDVVLLLPGPGRCRGEQLLESALEVALWAETRSMRARVILASSAQVYGTPTPGLPVRESHASASDGAGKELAALESELFERARRRGFSAIAARLFEVLLPMGILGGPHVEHARRVRSGELGAVAGLGLTRDYLDVRDVVTALVRLAQVQDEREPRVEAINVCSGKAVSGHDLVREVVRALPPRDEIALMAQLRPAPDEPTAAPWLVGDPLVYVQRTGYPAARISLRQTIEDACAA